MPLPMSRYERNAIEQGRLEGRQETLLAARQEMLQHIGILLKSKFDEAGEQFALNELSNADTHTLREFFASFAKVATLDELRDRLTAPV